ncbi:Protein O-linked-mannose beta-1,4-N-acetylglucosaminyltransferase 2 [Quaeritorhiza haematococci]|nr:Protein O-linked-mannose beta-1,4-N-acetylglucosaminyltransferase 2 [Quaeritorhiza haematococci]
MFSRLHPRNIMHNLHDDALGMYFVLKQYVGQGSTELNMPFSLDGHRILILDPYPPTDSTRPLQYLSFESLRFRAYIEQDSDVITCFRDAVVGNSKITTWYQYGFDYPQGPIPGKTPNGNQIREVAEWYARRMGLPMGVDEKYDRDYESPSERYEREKREGEVKKREQEDPTPTGTSTTGDEPSRTSGNKKVVKNNKGGQASTDHQQLEEDDTDTPAPFTNDKSSDLAETDLIVILSRRGNRLILNEEELALALETEFGYKAILVRNEDHSFEEQVGFMRRARMVLGMHGSIMVMTMFCRRGTVVLEMFPFGVPPENYTPYRTLAQLPGMMMVYRSWVNSNESMAIPHPDSHQLTGGIAHLSPEEQQDVIDTKTVPIHTCCSNPYWLYRIYQDTIANTTEIISVLQDALLESRKHLRTYILPRNHFETDLLPSPVTEIVCLDGPLRKPGELWAEWNRPWNKARVDKWNIFVQGTGKEYVAEGGVNVMAIGGFEPGSEVVFWVRPVVGKFKGEFGAMGKCVV